MNDEERMRAEILAMRERGDQITDEVHTYNLCLLVKFAILSCAKWVSCSVLVLNRPLEFLCLIVALVLKKIHVQAYFQANH